MRYVKLEKAQELKNRYGSWINRKAHSGEGRTEVLKNILISKKREHQAYSNKERLYKVVFEFENGKKILADDFLSMNGLPVRGKVLQLQLFP
jgi:hypothetical protein